MTNTQAQILELFQTLPQSEQHDLAEQLYEQATRGSFYEQRLWNLQRRQRSRNHQIFNLIDVDPTTPNNFIEGTAVKQ